MTPISSNCCPHRQPFVHNLKGEIGDPQLLWGYGVGICTNRKFTHDFLNISKCNVLLYLPPFDRNSSVKMCPHPKFDLSHFGVRVDPEGLGRKWYQSKSRHRIPIRLLNTVQACLAPFGNNAQCGFKTVNSRQLSFFSERIRGVRQ